MFDSERNQGMSEGKSLKQQSSLRKKIKLAITILVLVLAATYVPAKLLAVRFTNQGTKLYNEGRFEEAIAQYEWAMKVYPGYKPARKYLCGVCIDKADHMVLKSEYSQAEKLYKKAINLDPDASDVHWKLATTYWWQGKRSEALTELEEHLKRKPNDELALNLQRNLRDQQ